MYRSILPPPDMEESLEITKIYSVLGMLDEKSPPYTEETFSRGASYSDPDCADRGGLVPRPGEISLAHGGVLFLDELPEFRKSVIEVLRQPLEEKSVQISRAYGNYRFPADFYSGGGDEPLSMRVLSGYEEVYMYACADPYVFKQDQPSVPGQN